jgi:universal stress protein E
MNRYDRILIIVDPTAATQPAVSKGAILAQRLSARLELLVCDTRAARESRLAAESIHGAKPYNAKALIELIAQPLRDRGLDVTTEVAWIESLDTGLVEHACRASANLVLKDTHHHSLAQRTFLTNTDWQLIRGCRSPLLLTKERAWSRSPRVLAAIDPEHVNDKPAQLDRQILERARSLADAAGGDLHIVHAYLPASIAASATATSLGAVIVSDQDLRQERESRMQSIRQISADFGVEESHVHLELGGPTAVLPMVAENIQADVIVMGAVSRRGLRRILMGSTAEDVLERLPCDAFVVKPENFSELSR